MSLRARLLLVLATVVAAALVSADFATYSYLRSFLLEQVDANLQADHQRIEQTLSGTFSGGDGPGPGGPAFGIYVAVLRPSGQLIYQPASPANDDEPRPELPAHIAGFSLQSDPHEPTTYFNAPSAGVGPEYRVRASKFGQGPYTGDILVVAVPLSDTEHTLHRLLLIEVMVTGAALLAVALGSWWLVRLGLRPLGEIERTAGAIAGGRLSERVPERSSRTELGRLAQALNAMLARIQDAFAARDRTEQALRQSEARMRQFVADASHELRTPLAAVSAYAELFDRGAKSRPQDLDRLLSGIRGESARMSRLVEDLMLLARMDEGPDLDTSRFDLSEVAREAVEAASAVGPRWPIDLDTPDVIEVQGDRSRLRQVFDNLLSNVRSHTPEGTRTTVRASREGEEAVCEVSDTGPGIDEGAVDRVFERFYRADPSRSREHGGAGLGLSIVGAIVTAHGGSVEAMRGQGGGTTIRFRLPAG